MTCSLYRFYDEDDRLLYIGITSAACARLAQHAALKEWFPKVTRSTFEHYPTRDAAMAAEKAAIVAEEPLHNLRHHPKRPSRAARPDEMDIEEVTEYLRVDVDIVLRWVAFGRIPHTRRKDGELVFRRTKVDDWMRSLRSRPVEVSA